MTTPKVYVGTYAKYNNANLEGKWLDLSEYIDAEDFYKACAELHSNESDPEFMFQDYEGFPEGMIGESFLNEDVWKWMELTEYEQQQYEAWISITSCDTDDFDSTWSDAQDHFAGEYDDWNDYAYSCVEEGLFGEVAEGRLANYIDYDAIARDLEIEMSGVTINGKLFVFYP